MQEGCLCISFRLFEKHYPLLSQSIGKESVLEGDVNWMCEMLLVMNGESDKAWNVKRHLLNEDKLEL